MTPNEYCVWGIMKTIQKISIARSICPYSYPTESSFQNPVDEHILN